MELNDYQKKAMETCMPSSDNFSYMMLNLMGEVGEFASKVAKGIRKEKLVIYNNKLNCTVCVDEPEYTKEIEREHEIMLEAGDILWQLAGLCHSIGYDLETVAKANLDKLASRQQRGVIDGEGDNR